MFVERLTSLSLPNTEIFCMTILFVLFKPLMHLNVIQLMNHCLLFMLILRAYIKNFDNLVLFFNQISKPVDIICLSETRLNDRNLGNSNIAGYTLYHCNSETKAGDSAIFVSERLKCQEMLQTKIKSKGCEDVWVEIVFNKKPHLPWIQYIGIQLAM